MIIMSTLRIPVSEKDHSTGNPEADKVLVEYGDYQCPHCGIAHPFIKKLLKQYRDEFRFIFRNFPLQESHPMAMMAAIATESAARQSKFWEMHDIIFEHQDALSPDAFLKFAARLKLDEKRFEKDLHDKELKKKVEEDMEGGLRSGVNGTPTFFLNGKKIDSYDETYESLAKLFR
jgi:protein-disulfide isomerase